MSALDRPYFSKERPMSSYTIVERRNGETRIERVMSDGQRVVISEPPKKGRPKKHGGCWQLSHSNGVSLPQKAKAEKLDVELGVPTTYREVGVAALPEFTDKKHKQKWMRAHHVVNHDPMWGDPVPGDFNHQ